VAVAPMRRIEVIGYRPVLDEVIDALQRAGAVQIEEAPERLATERLDAESERARLLDEYLADARFVRDLLRRYHTPTQPFAAFVSEKVHVSVEEFETLEAGARLMQVYRACDALSDELASAQRERSRLVALVKELEPWLACRLQIAQWKGTEHAVLIAGTVPAGDGGRIHQSLRDVAVLTSVAEYGGAGLRQAWIVLAHRSCEEGVRAALAASQFAEVSFEGLEDYPAEESARAAARIAELEAKIVKLDAQARELAKNHYAESVAKVEAIESEQAALAIRGHIGRTVKTFLVTGWVRASRQAEIEGALGPWAADLDVGFRQPADDEQPPVELDNPRWLRPFEVLTDLYGRPGYRELDPTPLLAPFFLLFFAICISDVGYGAMLIAGAMLIKHRLDVAPGVKRFCDLLAVGGGGAVVVGVLFASYFALPVEALPPLLRSLQVLDPLAQLQTFLIVTIGLGVTQVFFGVGISAYDAFRRGDAGAAVFEQLSTIFLFVMIAASAAVWSGNAVAGRALLVVGLLGTMLMQGRTLEAALNGKERPLWDRAMGWTWMAAMLTWVVSLAFGGPPAVLWTLLGITIAGLLVSKAVRRCVVSFLGGAYAVYGMSSFLGDILSYTRLAALGLSGALVGMVFNILAGMVWEPAAGLWASGGIGWLWAVLVVAAAASIFVFGHTFNVVINLLGAFVHPARLQFVEFFSKFYEGGGRPLAPFRFVTRSVVLHAGSARQEGGAG
jgi:V/A-type H+-transporting ATPase subunit I